MKKLILLFSLSLVVFACSSGVNDSTYFAHEFVQGNDTLPYRIMYPKGYKANKQYPLILFLHGSGERGTDNQSQLSHGGSLFQSDSLRAMHQAIVVFPQCPTGISWTHRIKEQKDGSKDWVFQFPLDQGPTWPTAAVNALVDSLVKVHEVDPQQLYIGGLSMGGIGTLEFLQRWPNKYSAAFVICGANDASLADAYQETPIWFFHGGKDDVVPNKYSRQIYNRIVELNPQTPSKYTLYPEDNHNSWDDAFAEPGLYEWLFQFHK